MYLEINNRQSGKTTRLVREAVSHLACGGHAHVVSSNHASARYLEKRIHEAINIAYPNNKDMRDRLRVTPATSKYDTLNHPFRGISHNFRRYWDEFAFCEGVIWRPGDYYCTSYNTPEFERNVTPLIIDTDVLKGQQVYEELCGEIVNELCKSDDKPKPLTTSTFQITFEKLPTAFVEADTFEELGSFIKFYKNDKVTHAVSTKYVIGISRK